MKYTGLDWNKTAAARADIRLYPTQDLTAILDEYMEVVRQYMDKISEHSFAGTAVGTVLDDALGTYGKMIRSRMLLLCGTFGPGFYRNKDRLCFLAAVVELIHLSSLIHDDIIDDAPYRRGQPSIQAKYGKDAAVYAGDFLIARIYYYLSKEEPRDISMLISTTVEQMCIGEIGQTRCRYEENVTMYDYLHNIQGKTTALFRTACRIGAQAGGCSQETTQNLERFGEYLGIMFQLRDDLLDFTSEKGKVGKETHKDFQDGIYTMPVLLALQNSKEKEELLELMRENARRPLDNEALARMEACVIRAGGVEATRSEIRSYQRKSESILNNFKQTPSVQLMQEILKMLEI